MLRIKSGAGRYRPSSYPVLTAAQARELASEAQRLIETIQPQSIVGLRDRALIGVMGYAWARADVVVAMQVRDYYRVGDRYWVRLRENGAERHEIVDRELEPHIDRYLMAAQIINEPRSPLFRATLSGTERIGPRTVRRSYVLALIKKLTNPAAIAPPKKAVDAKIWRRCAIPDAAKLIDNIPNRSTIGRRDRAILGLMLYALVPPKLIPSLYVNNYYRINDQSWIVLEGNPVPAPPDLAILMCEYVEGLPRSNGIAPLFRINRDSPMTVADIRKMVLRRRRETRRPR
jgi:hypothetical protein